VTTTKLLAFLTVGLMVFAVACGGDDDDDAAAPASGGASDSAPADSGGGDDAGDEGDGDDAAPSDSASEGSDSVGSVTIGADTWNIVASIQCSIATVENLPLVAIAGHAEGDESVEIAIDFDPRDFGLRLGVMGQAGEPSWSAVNESFTVQAGGNRISGEGTFSGGGEMVEGSFEATC
jgi:hypothetical protein